MEVLIQNNADSPFTVPIIGNNGTVERTLFLGEKQVTKVSQEIYEKFILPSGFYKSRIEDGTIRILNADMLGENAVEQSRQLSELAYQKYVDLMKKIRSAGGLANKQFQPYLNSDGTPKLELLHANFGRNIDPEVAEQFRIRYLAEANEGMHEDTLKLPGGVKVDAGVRDVEIIKETPVEKKLAEGETPEDDGLIDDTEAPEETQDEIETQDETETPAEEEEPTEPPKEIVNQIARVKKMKLGELKAMATAMELEYPETATERQLRTLITKELKKDK